MGADWSQGSLDVIHRLIAREVEVVSFISISSMVGGGALGALRSSLVASKPPTKVNPTWKPH